ncbi:MAG: xanthine dehydrogenase family protein subunit M [Syntrophobacteraceae bacterium]
METVAPGSISELWTPLENEPPASVCAGGTDLLVRMRAGLCAPFSIVLLDRVEELKGIEEVDDSIRIGACTTHTEILASDLVGKHLPVLAKAVQCLGSPTIRNMGTIGGNICTASPAGDTLPPLYVLGAEVELRTRNTTRRMPIADFIQGPGRTGLEIGEILSAIWIRKPVSYNVQHFEKVGLRNALACSIAGMAALLSIGTGGYVEKAAFAWGSVAPTVIFCPDAEKALLGQRISHEKLQEIAAIVTGAVSPISDVRADAAYRRTVAGNLLLRLADVSES